MVVFGFQLFYCAAVPLQTLDGTHHPSLYSWDFSRIPYLLPVYQAMRFQEITWYLVKLMNTTIWGHCCPALLFPLADIRSVSAFTITPMSRVGVRSAFWSAFGSPTCSPSGTSLSLSCDETTTNQLLDVWLSVNVIATFPRGKLGEFAWPKANKKTATKLLCGTPEALKMNVVVVLLLLCPLKTYPSSICESQADEVCRKKQHWCHFFCVGSFVTFSLKRWSVVLQWSQAVKMTLFSPVSSLSYRQQY